MGKYRKGVHLLLSMPPTLSPSRAMNAIKGKTSNRLMRDFRVLNRTFWGRHLWARGFFVATSGNVTDEVLKKYIEAQSDGCFARPAPQGKRLRRANGSAGQTQH